MASYDDDKLRVGRLSADWIPIEGDGVFRYRPKNIACYVEERGRDLPPEIQRRVAELEGARVRAANSHERFPHNSSIPSLLRFAASRFGEHEEPRMDFWFTKTDYFAFMATSAFDTTLDSLYDDAGTQTSLRERYLASVERQHLWDDPVPELSHSFGVYIALITADNKVILVQRSGRPKTISRSEFTTSVSEGMNWELDIDEANTLEPFRTAQRGIMEELGSEEAAAK